MPALDPQSIADISAVGRCITNSAMWFLAGLFYVAAFLILIVFFAGAAKVNQAWDQAADHQVFDHEREERVA
jgi:hypothetical protein